MFLTRYLISTSESLPRNPGQMDGNVSVGPALDSFDAPPNFTFLDIQAFVVVPCCHPWHLDSGNPCRNDGVFCLPGFVYNDDIWSLGTSRTSFA